MIKLGIIIVLSCIFLTLLKIEHYINPLEMENSVLELKQAEDRYNAAKQDKINMQNKVDTLQQKSDKLEDDLKKCRNEPEAKDIVYTDSEIKEKKALLLDYNLCFKEIEEIKESTNQVKDEYTDAKVDLDIFKREYDDLNKKIKDLRQNKIPKIEKDIINTQNNINNLNTEINNYNNKLMLC